MKIGDYFFNGNDPRRGAPFGAAGVHRWGYGGLNPHNQFPVFTDLIWKCPKIFQSVCLWPLAP